MPYGSDLTSEPEKLALDVGNRLCPGVIDHHQPGADDECTTSLILKYPQYVQDHLWWQASPEPRNTMTEVLFDIDCLGYKEQACSTWQRTRLLKGMANYV